MSIPPSARNRVAHSATTAGGPKERAVTRGNIASREGSRATVSALPVMTSTSSGAPTQASTSRKKFIRFTMESTNTVRHPHRSARTSPGKPPPLPRSRKLVGEWSKLPSQQSAKPFACSICGSMALGPKKPRALDSSRARKSQAFVTDPLCRRNHHETTRLFTLGPRDHVLILGQ
jgi:hypothetical protein